MTNGPYSKFEEEQILAEYKTLRDEIRDRLPEANKLFLFSFTLITVLWGIIFKLDAKNPYYFILSNLILIPIRSRYLWWVIGQDRLARYIASNIESKVKYLNWETENKNQARKREEESSYPFFSVVFPQDYAFTFLFIFSLVVWVINCNPICGIESIGDIKDYLHRIYGFIKYRWIPVALWIVCCAYMIYLEKESTRKKWMANEFMITKIR